MIAGTDRAKTETNSKEVSVAKVQTDVIKESKSDETWFVYILRCGDGTL